MSFLKGDKKSIEERVADLEDRMITRVAERRSFDKRLTALEQAVKLDNLCECHCMPKEDCPCAPKQEEKKLADKFLSIRKQNLATFDTYKLNPRLAEDLAQIAEDYYKQKFDEAVESYAPDAKTWLVIEHVRIELFGKEQG